MHCDSCGTELPAGAEYCPICGVVTPYKISASGSSPYDLTAAASPYVIPPQKPATDYGAPPYGVPQNPYDPYNPYGSLNSYDAPQQVPPPPGIPTLLRSPERTVHRLPRRMVLVGLTGLVAVGLAGGGLALLSRSKQPSSPSRSAGITPTSSPVPPQTSTPVSLGTILYTTYRNHRDEVHGVSWSPQGKRIASASADKTVQVWDAVNGGSIFIYTAHSGPVNSAVWSHDGQQIASASDDMTVQVWDVLAGNHIYTYSAHTGPVNAVAWSPAGPDGKRIASASRDTTVQVWDTRDGGHAFTYQGHSSSVNAVAWSPDGKRIASASDDATVQV